MRLIAALAASFALAACASPVFAQDIELLETEQTTTSSVTRIVCGLERDLFYAASKALYAFKRCQIELVSHKRRVRALEGTLETCEKTLDKREPSNLWPYATAVAGAIGLMLGILVAK